MQRCTTDDGLPLHLREWACAEGAEAAHGTVLIVHGLGEHIGRYERLAGALNAAGWHVAGYDQRGHGASGGPRGAIPQPDSLLVDLARVVDHVRERMPRGPLVLLGHSMGGAVASRFVAEALAAAPAAWSRTGVDALVLSSPALQIGMNAGQKLLLALGGALAPGVAVGNGLAPEWISRDAAVVEAYQRDPLVHDRVTPRLVRFMLDAGESVRASAARWRVPTLLMWAGADRCVAPAGSASFAAAAPRALVASQSWPALYHEIFNEPEREQVIARLTGWLVTHARKEATSR
jgi:alpha-beta hydrolase superfamily lysophospholipase